MKRIFPRNSITRRVRFSVWSIAAILSIPVIVSLFMMGAFSVRFHGMLSRMETAATLKPVVEETVPERLFSVAAGRARFEDSGVEEAIREVNIRMDGLLEESSGSGQLELRVARRTMDTLEQYVLAVRDGMAEGMPVDRVEAMVDEARDVGALIDDMLERFITAEISDASMTSRQLERMVLVSAGAEIAIVLLALLFTNMATNRVILSIRSSIRHLESIVRRLTGGNLRARVPEVDAEELQALAGQINLMADRLEEQIEQIRAGQNSLAKLELQLLQAQINPHFLYNTLDTIIWQAQSGKGEEVIRLTRALSDFFRISLSSGADWITVSQEKQHLEGYLSIQKIRYRDILDYSIDIPEELSEACMVKLLLQPRVENALYHGIKEKRGGGAIRVSADNEGAFMRFTVSDTGIGMTEAELEQVRRSLGGEAPSIQAASALKSGGFGLRNVDMRIRLYYRQERGLFIESDRNGTRVTFRIPRLNREDIPHDEGISGG